MFLFVHLFGNKKIHGKQASPPFVAPVFLCVAAYQAQMCELLSVFSSVDCCCGDRLQEFGCNSMPPPPRKKKSFKLEGT